MIQRFFAFQKSHLISLCISVSSWIQTLILLFFFFFFLFPSIFFVLQSQSSSNCMTRLHVKRRERLNVEKTPGTASHIKWKSFLVLFDPDHPASETLLPVHKWSTMTNLRKCFMLSLSVCACQELGPHIRAKRGSPELIKLQVCKHCKSTLSCHVFHLPWREHPNIEASRYVKSLQHAAERKLLWAYSRVSE